MSRNFLGGRNGRAGLLPSRACAYVIQKGVHNGPGSNNLHTNRKILKRDPTTIHLRLGEGIHDTFWGEGSYTPSSRRVAWSLFKKRRRFLYLKEGKKGEGVSRITVERLP